MIEGEGAEAFKQVTELTPEQQDALFAIEKISAKVFPKGMMFVFAHDHPQKGLGVGAMVKTDPQTAVTMYHKLTEALLIDLSEAVPASSAAGEG